jgi:8-oxo-dGTP pyrophosphatase MutT (NUDIX family)
MERGFREGYAPLNRDDWKRIDQYEKKTGLQVEEVEERCGGCFVFSRDPDGTLVVLMIEQRKDNYLFPKGHLDDGEDDITAAIRETFEETGVSVQREELAIDEPIYVRYSGAVKLHSGWWEKHPDYPDRTKRPLVIGHKTVAFYCAYLPVMEEGFPQDGEALSVKWFPIREATKKLSGKAVDGWKQALNTNFVKNLMNSHP